MSKWLARLKHTSQEATTDQVPELRLTVATVAEKPEPLTELPLSEEINIRAWLKHIEETDPDIITETVDRCRDDLDARRYFLMRSKEVREPAVTIDPVACHRCIHCRRTDHPRLGHCAKGEPEAIAGLWDSDQRYCGQFLPLGGAE